MNHLSITNMLEKFLKKSKLPVQLTDLRNYFEVIAKKRKIKGVEKTYYTVLRNKYYRKMMLSDMLKNPVFVYLDDAKTTILARKYTKDDALKDRELINKSHKAIIRELDI